MSTSAGEHKCQERDNVQVLIPDVVILVQLSIVPLGLDDVCIIEKQYNITILLYDLFCFLL